MWGRAGHASNRERHVEAVPNEPDQDCRRAYYRVAGLLPIRLVPIPASEVDGAVFDLSIPDPLLQPVVDCAEETPLMERLRRIEEKLDLLLGASEIDCPTKLSGRDRKSVVFSGAGLALDVDAPFSRGDAFKVEILLPPPYSRTIRAVAIAVDDSSNGIQGEGRYHLPLALTHMEDDERDALVAYSYDIQRFALRTRLDHETPR